MNKYELVLHIKVPDIYADDLKEHARIWTNNDNDNDYEPTPKDMGNVILAEWMRPEVGITCITLPGDNDFAVISRVGEIVGADVRAKRTQGLPE